MRYLIHLLILFSSFSLSATDAQTSALREATERYSAGNYKEAIKLYEKIIADGYESPELYYNLGNAYYKSNTIALAILNYERAKKLAPGDEDIQFNLKMAYQQIQDKIEPVPQLFIKELQHDFLNSYSEKTWSLICITFFFLAFLSLILYILTGKTITKQLGFGMALLFFIASFSTFFIAKVRYKETSQKTEAVIVSPIIEINSSPSENGTKLFLLHEGCKVIIQKTEGQWSEIKLANGNVGWVKKEAFVAF